MTLAQRFGAPLLIAAVAATFCSKRENGSNHVSDLPPPPTHEAHVFAGGVRPPSAGPRKPHVPGAEHATAGARLFTSMNCDGCHGSGATGFAGPSLVDGRWRYGGADEAVFDSIFYGRPKGMPAYGGVLGSEGVWMIVSYLKAQPVPSVVPTTSYENKEGDAAAVPAAGATSAPAREKVAGERPGVEGLLAKYACTACHAVDARVIGPGFSEVAAKYRGQKDVERNLAEKVRNGGSGVWGQIPMTPNPSLPDNDLHTIIEWILSLR
jgi:cytochrome c